MPDSHNAVRIHKRSSFQDAVIVPNGTAQDQSLSWAARGLLLFCLSLPEGWQIREDDLIGRSPQGRDHLRSIVRELEAHGYIRRTQTRLQNGHVGPADWEVWDTPQGKLTPPPSRPGVKAEPQTGNPSTEKPSTVKPARKSPKTRVNTGKLPQTGNPSTEKPSTVTVDGLTVDGKSDSIERTTLESIKGLSNYVQEEGSGEEVAAAPLPGSAKPPKDRFTSKTLPADSIPLDLHHVADLLTDWWACKPRGRTERAFHLACTKLRGYSPAEQRQMLESAIIGGWQGLYEPRLPTRSSGGYPAQQPSATDRVIAFLNANGH